MKINISKTKALVIGRKPNKIVTLILKMNPSNKWAAWGVTSGIT